MLSNMSAGSLSSCFPCLCYLRLFRIHSSPTQGPSFGSEGRWSSSVIWRAQMVGFSCASSGISATVLIAPLRHPPMIMLPYLTIIHLNELNFYKRGKSEESVRDKCFFPNTAYSKVKSNTSISTIYA